MREAERKPSFLFVLFLIWLLFFHHLLLKISTRQFFFFNVTWTVNCWKILNFFIFLKNSTNPIWLKSFFCINFRFADGRFDFRIISTLFFVSNEQTWRRPRVKRLLLTTFLCSIPVFMRFYEFSILKLLSLGNEFLFATLIRKSSIYENFLSALDKVAAHICSLGCESSNRIKKGVSLFFITLILVK